MPLSPQLLPSLQPLQHFLGGVFKRSIKPAITSHHHVNHGNVDHNPPPFGTLPLPAPGNLPHCSQLHPRRIDKLASGAVHPLLPQNPQRRRRARSRRIAGVLPPRLPLLPADPLQALARPRLRSPKGQVRVCGWVDGLVSPVPALFLSGGRLQDGDDLRAVQRQIGDALAGLDAGRKRRVVLVLDQPDFLVASTSAGGGEGAGIAVRDVILDLREKVHSCVVTVSADDPLVHPPVAPTPLETNHSWFVLSLLHEADMLCALRLLDTGTAKDVSGVVRIASSRDGETEDREYLYKVGGHGGAKVFERGQ
ncbi:Putative protein of unknown function [Podospora comata]|uniref:Uncharacterized protein n=1 Tax=Podospora comata TaxID=48703 RepID=A0ABY6RZ22_PODCO|nr:Putative protein of unknown function [Podospora comata]